MISLLFIVLVLAATPLAWLYRQRLVRYLPRKNTMFAITLIAAIVLLAILAVLPDLITMLSALQLLSPFVRTVLVLAIAVPLLVVGCVKRDAAASKPHSIEWRGPATGYEDTTPTEPHK